MVLRKIVYEVFLSSWSVAPRAWHLYPKMLLPLLPSVSLRTSRVLNTRSFAQAAFGTCSEPSRLINADKTWSTRVDITHLQPYLQAGMPTRFSLANVLSNTYNVPIWARARLDVYHKHAQPSASAKTHRQQRQQQHQQQLLPQQSPSQQEDPHHAVGRALHGMAVVQAASASALPLSLCDTPAVPDEVMPLVPPGQAGMEALSVFGGQGDRCATGLSVPGVAGWSASFM
jgi:hypothetical protein